MCVSISENAMRNLREKGCIFPAITLTGKGLDMITEYRNYKDTALRKIVAELCYPFLAVISIVEHIFRAALYLVLALPFALVMGCIADRFSKGFAAGAIMAGWGIAISLVSTIDHPLRCIAALIQNLDKWNEKMSAGSDLTLCECYAW